MKLSEQMIRKVQADSEFKRTTKKVSFEKTISTGSTLLDLAIAGGRTREGGLPGGGILVEIFGPSGTGKTVLLCSIGYGIQKQGGDLKFSDPEARLNKQFASMFGVTIDEKNYGRPDTVTELFEPIRDWEPKGGPGVIHGVLADSLAALSTDMEMEGEDKYGMRRAKEFSEQLRKTCRILPKKNILMVCSNQVRENLDAGMYGQKFIAPGGKAIEFYSSVRLRMVGSEKLKKEGTFKGKKISKVIGIKTTVEVCKSSVDSPLRTAPLMILFDYGIDDIRANLQYIKDYSSNSFYSLGDTKLSNSMEEAINLIEENEWEQQLKDEVIELWNAIEIKMKTSRKSKKL